MACCSQRNDGLCSMVNVGLNLTGQSLYPSISRAIVIDGQSCSGAGCIVDNGVIDVEIDMTETGNRVRATG